MNGRREKDHTPIRRDVYADCTTVGEVLDRFASRHDVPQASEVAKALNINGWNRAVGRLERRRLASYLEGVVSEPEPGRKN